MFRIPEVRISAGRRFRRLILTVSSSELIHVILSCVLLYLAVDYVLCALFSLPKSPLRFIMRTHPTRQKQALAGYVRTHSGAASHRLCCLTTTVTNDDHITCQLPDSRTRGSH